MKNYTDQTLGAAYKRNITEYNLNPSIKHLPTNAENGKSTIATHFAAS